ncbi:hypothetical protein G9A89_004908 [Geosiphon pyriformis]|nr:hypothetical protein G9A89_004908 [Geosiphon pyriformis]
MKITKITEIFIPLFFLTLSTFIQRNDATPDFNESNELCYNDNFKICFTSGSNKPKSCEKQFGVSSCSNCQKAIYSVSPNPINKCLSRNRIRNNPNPNANPSYQAQFDSFCGENCDSNAVATSVQKLEDGCKSDIMSAKDKNFGSILKGILLEFYTSIPTRNAYCLKNDNNDYLASQNYFFFVEYVFLQLLNQANVYVSNLPKDHDGFLTDFKKDFNPPTAQLTYQSLNNETQHVVNVPKDILCGEDYKDITQIWVDWDTQTPLTIPNLRHEFSQSLAPVEGNLTSQCGVKFNPLFNNTSNDFSSIAVAEISKIYESLKLAGILFASVVLWLAF